jgi:hypothetical protein
MRVDPIGARLAETWCLADFTGLMFFEARFVASLRIADHPEDWLIHSQVCGPF